VESVRERAGGPRAGLLGRHALHGGESGRGEVFALPLGGVDVGAGVWQGGPWTEIRVGEVKRVRQIAHLQRQNTDNKCNNNNNNNNNSNNNNNFNYLLIII
jgi:hypothetical protein